MPRGMRVSTAGIDTSNIMANTGTWIVVLEHQRLATILSTSTRQLASGIEAISKSHARVPSHDASLARGGPPRGQNASPRTFLHPESESGAVLSVSQYQRRA